MNENEKNNNIEDTNSSNVELNETLEEIANNIGTFMPNYNEYTRRQHRRQQNYSFGSGNFNFVTNNPLIARFFVYPFDLFILLIGIAIVVSSPGFEKIPGIIIILVSIYTFIKFREKVRIAKEKRKDIQSNV